MVNNIKDPNFSNIKMFKNNNIINFDNINSFKINKFDNNTSYNKNYNIDITYKKIDNILFLYLLLILNNI